MYVDSHNLILKTFVPGHYRLRHRPWNHNLSGDIAGLFYHLNVDQIDHSEIQHAASRYPHVVVYVCEPLPNLLSFLEQMPPNVMVFTDVLTDDPPANHGYVGNWFMTFENIYREYFWARKLIDDIDHERSRPYMFDCLLGIERENKQFVYGAYARSTIKDKIFMVYHRDNMEQGVWDLPYVKTPTEGPFPKNAVKPICALWTEFEWVDALGYPQHRRIGTQHLLPVSIYNDCWYSIVAEGFCFPGYSRFTEKTAKVLAAGKLFVSFGAQHDLRRLRSLGFQTFHGIIDESYDLEPDKIKRWHAAWQQVKWLCDQDPHEIQRATQIVRSHNQRVFLETDWFQNLRDHLASLVTA